MQRNTASWAGNRIWSLVIEGAVAQIICIKLFQIAAKTNVDLASFINLRMVGTTSFASFYYAHCSLILVIPFRLTVVVSCVIQKAAIKYCRFFPLHCCSAKSGTLNPFLDELGHDSKENLVSPSLLTSAFNTIQPILAASLKCLSFHSISYQFRTSTMSNFGAILLRYLEDKCRYFKGNPRVSPMYLSFFFFLDSFSGMQKTPLCKEGKGRNNRTVGGFLFFFFQWNAICIYRNKTKSVPQNTNTQVERKERDSF